MLKTRKNYEEIYPVGRTYTRGVRAGNMLFLSGMTARNSDVVMITTYVTNIADFWPIEGEQREYPTNSYVEVSALAEPGLNIELTATAVLD